MKNQYFDVGDRIELSAKFYDASETLADPTTVTLKVKDPAGTVTTYSGGQLTNSTVGTWTCEVTLAQSGSYQYRWTGTGALTAAVEGHFHVRESAFS